MPLITPVHDNIDVFDNAGRFTGYWWSIAIESKP